LDDGPWDCDTETHFMQGDNAELRRLKEMIDKCSRAVVFTGAGISTESGIPDFRSPNGIWSQATPIYFDEFVSSEAARREAWRRKFAIDRDIDHAEPNRGHRAVAKLVREGVVSSVITQNIDGLHQLSGVPEENIIELHGNGTYAKCLTCGARHELAPLKQAFLDQDIIPECQFCGGLVKGATISFGQAMPEDEMRRARDETLTCDLFIAIGSSLVVYPAAGFPAIAKENGAQLVILNREPTDLDDLADLVLNLEIGPTLGEAANVN
jgi:NAD-dependent protein deacetylase/lipoamidase